ncbi:DUF4190 domain-containing protein [Nocardia heshunensis]
MTYDPPPPGWDPQSPGYNPQQPVDFTKQQPPQQPMGYGHDQPQAFDQPPAYDQPPGYGQPQAYGQPPGYNPQPGYPQGYPQPTPGYYPQYYGAPQPDHPQAVVVLILGIASLVFCQLLGPVAWIMGSRARKDIQASGGAIGGSGMVTAGWICGIVSSALMILVIVGFVLLAVIGAVASN